MSTILLLAFLGCGQDDVAPRPDKVVGSDEITESVDVTQLTASRHLFRASMALTGARPSPEAIADVSADPEALAGWVDGYLDDDRFRVTLRDMHDEWWLFETSSGSLSIGGSLDGTEPAKIVRELPLMPLKLIENVVMDDRPYSEILTSETMYSNRVTSAAWEGLPAITDDAGWLEVQWEDGRPRAGILSDSWLFLAYRSALGNHNRGRANAITSRLLCLDFLENSPIPDDAINLSDPAEVIDAVRNDPACLGCHEALDPLASFFTLRAYPIVGEETWPKMMYTPAFDDLWKEVDGLPPAYFSEPGDDVTDLAVYITEDPRFTQCTVRNFVSYLEQRPLHEVSGPRINELTEAFEASGMNARQLVRDIVLSEAFADQSDEGAGPQYLRPEHLGPLFDDLVGFVWSGESDAECCGNSFGDGPYGSVPDLSRDAFIGYRLLMGGVDGPHVTVATHTSTPSSTVVVQAYAELAAYHEADNLRAGSPRLLTLVDANTTNDDALREQLVALHVRLYAETVAIDDPILDDTLELFQFGMDRHDDPAEAWRLVLTAMFQDFRMVTY